MAERITGQTHRQISFFISKDFAHTGLNLTMLRDGKETLFFSKVLLSTEILGSKTAHFTGKKTEKKERKKLSALIRQHFPRRPISANRG